MKEVPKYDYANEFYNFSDDQVRIPEKIYVFSSINYAALSIQLEIVLIIAAALCVYGESGHLNNTALEGYSHFNRPLSIINMLWFFGILFGETLPYLFSTEAPDADIYALLQMITLVTPALTIWALRPHASVNLRLIAVMQNMLTASFLYLTGTSIPIGKTIFFLFSSILYLPESPEILIMSLYTLAIDYTGAINAMALLITTIRSITTKPSSGP